MPSHLLTPRLSKRTKPRPSKKSNAAAETSGCLRRSLTTKLHAVLNTLDNNLHLMLHQLSCKLIYNL